MSYLLQCLRRTGPPCWLETLPFLLFSVPLSNHYSDGAYLVHHKRLMWECGSFSSLVLMWIPYAISTQVTSVYGLFLCHKLHVAFGFSPLVVWSFLPTDSVSWVVLLFASPFFAFWSSVVTLLGSLGHSSYSKPLPCLLCFPSGCCLLFPTKPVLTWEQPVLLLEAGGSRLAAAPLPPASQGRHPLNLLTHQGPAL